MKEKMMHNMSLKLLSLFIAFVTWLVIVNIEDPTISKNIKGINVQVVNENAISEAGKCYVIDSDGTVDIRVRGPKSVIDKLEPSDFKAVADLSKYSITNAVPVEVEFYSDRKFSIEPDIIYGKNSSINIILDDFVTQTFEIVADMKGRATDGYYISNDEVKADSDKVKISGPESIIKNIGKVVAVLDITDIKEETTIIAKVKVLDIYDKEIVSDRISFNRNVINITVKPLIEKEVPIKVVAEGKPKKEYSVNNTTCSLASIKVVGDQESVDAMQVIELKVDVTDKNKKIKKEFDLLDYISSTVRISSEEHKAKVEIDFKKMISRKVSFKATDIEFRNIKNGYLNKFDNDKKLEITLKGLEQYIDNITIAELKPYIDLGNIKEGHHKVKVLFENTNNITISKDVYLEIDIESGAEVSDTVETEGPRVNDNNSEDGNDEDEMR